MPTDNLPKVLIQVSANGLVHARGSVPMRIAVVNRPRLRKLSELAPRNFAQALRAATRFIKRETVSASTLISTRDTAANALSPNVGGADEAPRARFRVPVRVSVEVEARSAEEARRLAFDELGLDRNDNAEAGDPVRL